MGRFLQLSVATTRIFSAQLLKRGNENAVHHPNMCRFFKKAATTTRILYRWVETECRNLDFTIF